MTIPRVIGPIALAAMALATSPIVRAQNAPASETARAAKPLVIVCRQIDGRTYKGPGGNWHRIEVEVKAQSEAIKAALMAQGATQEFATPVRWLNNVKVSLVAGYAPTGADLMKPKVYQELLKLKESAASGKPASDTKNAKLVENWRFYKASATALTLEANVPRSIFFYIPADIVKRDDIVNPRPDVAYVALEMDGQEIPVLNDKGALHGGSFGVLFGGPLAGKVDKTNLDKVREIADRATRDTDGVMRPQNLITGFIDTDWKNSPEFVRDGAAK